MGKGKKKRLKETKWIQQQLQRKKIKRCEELSVMLEELQLCYIVGANKACQLLTEKIVRRYVQSVYLLAEGELDRYASPKEQAILQSNEKCLMIVQHLRSERSPALELLNGGLQLMRSSKKDIKLTPSKKQTKVLLQKVEQLMML